MSGTERSMRVLRRASSPVKLRGVLIRDDGLTSPPPRNLIPDTRGAQGVSPGRDNSSAKCKLPSAVDQLPTRFSGATSWIHDADGSRSLLHCRCFIGCFTRTKCTDPASISLEKLSVKSDATIHVDRLPGDRAGLV